MHLTVKNKKFDLLPSIYQTVGDYLTEVNIVSSVRWWLTGHQEVCVRVRGVRCLDNDGHVAPSDDVVRSSEAALRCSQVECSLTTEACWDIAARLYSPSLLSWLTLEFSAQDSCILHSDISLLHRLLAFHSRQSPKLSDKISIYQSANIAIIPTTFDISHETTGAFNLCHQG